MGELDSAGDARDSIKDVELGSDQMLIGESPSPSSQSNEVSLPSVFQMSIISGRIIIEADLEDVEELEEHVEDPVDEVICDG